MTTRLRLICHAPTAATRASAFPADEPIEPKARELLALCGRPDSDACWTSPATRARQTAAALRLDAAIDPRLRECDHGRWTGLTLETVQAKEPEALSNWLRDPTARPHGGETIVDLIARIAAWMDVTMAPGRIVAVTHASVVRAAIVHALDVGPRAFWRLDIAPLTVVTLSGLNKRWNLVTIQVLS